MSGNRALGRLALIVLVVAAALAGVAWFTELRAVLHGGLIALCVVAFLPFIAIVVGLTLLAVLTLVAGLAGDHLGVESQQVALGVRGGASLVRRYYAFLSRQAAGPWLGLPIGVMLGIFLVWALLALLVLPKELRTTELLLASQAAIEQRYVSSGDYPAPRSDGFFAADGGELVRDAFGTPLRYEVGGAWKLKSYRLVSSGSDRVPSSDDLCVEGQTKLQGLVDRSAALLELAARVRSASGAAVHDQLQTLHGVQCDVEALESSAAGASRSPTSR